MNMSSLKGCGKLAAVLKQLWWYQHTAEVDKMNWTQVFLTNRGFCPNPHHAFFSLLYREPIQNNSVKTTQKIISVTLTRFDHILTRFFWPFDIINCTDH